LDEGFITGLCVGGKRSSQFSSKDGYVATFLQGSTLRTLVELISVMLAVISGFEWGFEGTLLLSFQ
jgi:hypothetical protein